MKKNIDISAIAVNDTIQIFFGDQSINIQKNSDNKYLFESVFNLIKEQKLDELKERFFEIKEAIEKYTKGNFAKKETGELCLKGDTEPIPTMLAKKLLEFKDAGLDFMPLVRFWKKLKSNPDPKVKLQLYDFILHNKIPITELGDVICEKGVKEDKNGRLVDQRTGDFDNSIGMVVSMKRDLVNSNPNQTCEAGLHVAAPEFVRKHWGSGVLIEVEVNPADFVAIPTDYNETKARVCRYKVLGIAPKDGRKMLLYNFNDIIAPTHAALEDQKQRETFSPGETKKYDGNDKNKIDFSKMTARAIVEYTELKYGIEINIDLKNKKAIIKKAEEIFSKPVPVYNVGNMSAKEIIEMVKTHLGIELKIKKPWRKQIVERATKLFNERGFTLTDK